MSDLAWTSDGARDIEPVINSLQELIAPDAWDRAGGPAYAMELGKLLVVSADADIHRATTWFLAALRTRDAVQPLRVPAPADGWEERYLRAYDSTKLWDGWLTKAGGAIGLDGFTQIRKSTDDALAKLRSQIRQIDSRNYMEARNFLTSLAHEANFASSG